MSCSATCADTTADTSSVFLGSTPFGFDFEDGEFPSPWNDKALVALHGEEGTWTGARVVAVSLDPTTGSPVPSSPDGGTVTTDGGTTPVISDFVRGWDDGTLSHGRPADIAISSDGRVFIANDVTGEIFWIAPVSP